MLNRKLYQALQKVFGEVETTNEGVSAEVTQEFPATTWHISGGHEHGEQYRVSCPFCRDRHKHLYISYLSYAAPVKNGLQLMEGPLMAQCFRRDCIHDRANRDALDAKLRAAMSGADGEVTPCFIEQHEEASRPLYEVSSEVTLEGIRTWVPDFQFAGDDADADIIDYLVGRGITRHELDWLRIGWGPVKSPRSGKYLNGGHPWVLFPVIQNGQLTGVQGRCPDKFLREDSIRYWFHPGMRKRMALYNIDVARRHGVGVLCEGVFDVAHVGKPGIATFGLSPSTAQYNLMGTLSQALIWLPDMGGDSKENPVDIARRKAAEWNAQGTFPLGAHVVILPMKDAGEMNRQDIWATILSQVPAQLQDYLYGKVLGDL